MDDIWRNFTIQSLKFHPFIDHSDTMWARWFPSAALWSWQVMVIHASLCGACAFKPLGSSDIGGFLKWGYWYPEMDGLEWTIP